MPVSDFVFIGDRPAGVGSGTNDFAFFGSQSAQDNDKGTFVYEGDTLIGFGGFVIRPPFDIWATSDNFYDIYVNSVNNRVAFTDGSDENVTDPELLEWEDVEFWGGISAPEGPGVLGWRSWNGPNKDDEVSDPDTESQTMIVFALEDADGRVYEFSPDLTTFRVFDNFESPDPNPFGEDWVDRDFDDSNWVTQNATAFSVGSYNWGGTGTRDLLTSDFGGNDPHFLTPTATEQNEPQDGYAFYRIPVTFI